MQHGGSVWQQIKTRIKEALQERKRFPDAIRREWQTLQNPLRENSSYPPARIDLTFGWSERLVLLLILSLVLALLLFGHVSPTLHHFITNRNEALKEDILIRADDIRNEKTLIDTMYGWLSQPAWKSVLNDKLVKVLESVKQVSSTSSPARRHKTRIAIIDGLNALIQGPELPPTMVKASPGAAVTPKHLPFRLPIRKKWLQQMIQNRRTIEKSAPGALFSFFYPFATTMRSLSNFARFGWIAPAAMLIVFLLAVLDNQSPGEGEPFSWTNGASAWPTQLLRVLTIGLAIGLLFRGEEDLRRNQLALSRRFLLSDGDEQRLPYNGNRIPGWLHSPVAVRAKRLWLEYRWLGRWRNRARRVFFMATVYIGALVALSFAVSGMPPMPIRGVICNTVNLFLLWTVVIATVLLNFFVVDATRLCQRFIQNLNNAPTIYPKETREKFRGDVDKAADDDLDDWLDMQIIATRSAEVSRLIYYPFVTLFLLVLARARYWDDWTWQPLLILIFVFNIAWAVSSAVVLQRSAKAAKAQALESLRQKMCRLPESGSELRLYRFTKMREDISALNSGVFAGYFNNPILGALSLPLAGTVIAFIVQFMTSG